MSLAWELVSEIVVTSATSSVSFSGLSFGEDDDLMVLCDIVNTSAGGSRYSLCANGNTTLTDYYTQRLTAGGSSLIGVRYNDNVIGYNTTSSYSRLFSSINVKQTGSGHFVCQANANFYYSGGSVIDSVTLNCASTFTISSITQLTVSSHASNCIGSGSRIQLYKRIAEVVADVEVTSATTSVDITGLNILKNNEYRLISQGVNNAANVNFSLFANANLTASNYYSQRLYASSTTVSAARSNDAVYSGNRDSFTVTDIKVTNSGYFTAQSHSAFDVGLSTLYFDKRFITSTFSVSSISQLTVIAASANEIGVGSRFQLLKMK